MKKKLFTIFAFLFFSSYAFSQGVGIGTAVPDPSAALDITNTNKGLLIPRMNTAAIAAIINPSNGLLVYDNQTNQLKVNIGTSTAPDFQPVAANSLAWNLTGNNGINAATQFIGSINNQPLRFRVNNIWVGELHPVTGNIFWGLRAGQSTTTGIENVAIGRDALTSNTTGSSITAVGAGALLVNTTGIGNSALGANALTSNTTGESNTGVGFNALLRTNTGIKNTGVGMEAMRANTTGFQNTALGQAAMLLNTIGNQNVAIGTGALLVAPDANENTAIGFNAGSRFSIGSNNVFLGSDADAAGNNIFNSVAIGRSARVTGSNQVRFGNATTTSIGGIVGYTNLSDGRFKKNIQDGVKGLDFIMKLRPVTYQLDLEGINRKMGVDVADATILRSQKESGQTIFSGFVAQEVEQSAKAISYDFSGVDKPRNENDMYGLRYAEFVVPLVKAMQEQQQLIIELKKQNEELQKRVLALEKK
jgi:trimeric autotransporter adhesin